MLFDTHAHYDDEWFDADRDALLRSMPEYGVGLIVNPGCDVESSKMAVQLAHTYPHVYAAVGIHPENALGWCMEDVEEIERLAREDKVQAIGEIGLDYYWLKQSPETTPPREEQQAAFRAQMALAERLALPVIVHDRDAHADCLAIVKEFPNVHGVYHCYSGSYETAKELIDMGWMLSFTGVITHDNSKKVRRILQNIPLEHIMIETDSPYMTPAAYKIKGQRVRNCSRYVRCVADKIAEICGMTREEVERITTENGKRFFGISE